MRVCVTGKRTARYRQMAKVPACRFCAGCAHFEHCCWLQVVRFTHFCINYLIFVEPVPRCTPVTRIHAVASRVLAAKAGCFCLDGAKPPTQALLDCGTGVVAMGVKVMRWLYQWQARVVAFAVWIGLAWIKTENDALTQVGDLQLTDTAPSRIWSVCTGLEKASGECKTNVLNLCTKSKSEPTAKDWLILLCCMMRLNSGQRPALCVCYQSICKTDSLCEGMYPACAHHAYHQTSVIPACACPLMNSLNVRLIRTHVTRAWYHVECANLWLHRVEADVAGPHFRINLPRY